MAKNPDHYAIVIGIGKYRQLSPLNAPYYDAIKFAEWLKSEDGGGLPDDTNHIRIILAPENPPTNNAVFNATPTQKEIDDCLKYMGVEKGERIGRRLYFYFAGHGFGPIFDDVGMLLADATEDFSSNLGFRCYSNFFHQYYCFDEIVYVLDCCRNLAPNLPNLHFGEPKFKGNGDPFAAPVEDFVVKAATHGQPAYEMASKKNGDDFRGVLTEVLLEGMQTACDEHGRITADSLREYMLEQVPLMAKTNKRFQLPDIDPPNREIVFVVRPPIHTIFKVSVITKKRREGVITLYDADANPVESRPAKDVTREHPWELELTRCTPSYSLEHSVTGEQKSIRSLDVKNQPHVITFK